MKATTRVSLALALGLLPMAITADASIIWNGPPITFSKLSSADPTLPANQDRITPLVWITRAGTRGIYNAKTESSYVSGSPADTDWAYGTTANLPNLTFSPWVVWNGKTPPLMVGLDAVVHLISEDIYIDIKFTLWQDHGGNFTYMRATQSCQYALSPLDLSNTAAVGATPVITVTVPAGCPVAATSFQPWVTVGNITPSGGTTTVSLQISPNAGAARATSIVVADRLYLITQLGGGP